MVAFDRTDGLKQATLIIASTAGLYYIWDLVNDCKVNDAKKQKILFLLLTLFLYMNINWWFSGLKAINETEPRELENGDFTASASGNNAATASDQNGYHQLVRNGIPGVTDNRRHEITLAFKTTGNDANKATIINHSTTYHPDSSAPISEHDRNFKHFAFCIAFSAVLTGIFSIVGTK